MSKWTETRDGIEAGAQKAWDAASPETRAFVVGFIVGAVITGIVALAWAL